VFGGLEEGLKGVVCCEPGVMVDIAIGIEEGLGAYCGWCCCWGEVESRGLSREDKA
jgi:hypothetical protein